MNQRMNRTALITGSGRKRVGYEIAKHLAKEGYNIAVHYNSSEEAAKKNVEEFRAIGVESESFQADVSKDADIQRLVNNAAKRFGSLNVLVTTSSIWKTIKLEEVTEEDVLSSFGVNTLGTFFACKHVGLKMVDQSTGGAIITIGDSLIRHPYTDHAAYFTAKGSIPTLTKCFAVELASRNPNVRVNCIEPGPVMFPEDLPDEKKKAHVDSTLTNTADCPDAVAQTVLYLVNNPMLTGCCIPLDGGRNVGHEHHARQG